MKGALSAEFAQFLYVVCVIAAACTPIAGLFLARYSLPLAYQYSTVIWFLWAAGNLGSLIWSALLFKIQPAHARLAFAAVVFSLLTATFLPRM
jgi:hypothetical protein